MINPTLQPVRHLSRVDRWHGPVALALFVTALGALVGSAVSALLASAGIQWAGEVPVITPLLALLAATSVYRYYRHRPLDWLQARLARILVATVAALLMASVGLAAPGLAVVALWAMTASTVIVTALAAGAGSSEILDDTLDPGWA